MENGGHNSHLVILAPAPKESLEQGTKVPNGVVPSVLLCVGVMISDVEIIGGFFLNLFI